MEDNGVSTEQLIRIEGKLELINEKINRFTDDLKDMRDRLHGHSNRLAAIEARNHLQTGERKGAETVVRLLWAVFGIGSAGVVAFVLRSFGV